VEEIPSVYHQAAQLAKSGYNYSELNSTLPRNMFPPRVHYILNLSTQWAEPPEEVDQSEIQQAPRTAIVVKRFRWVSHILKALLFVCLFSILMSMLPVVE
jgi:hypothetical protein